MGCSRWPLVSTHKRLPCTAYRVHLGNRGGGQRHRVDAREDGAEGLAQLLLYALLDLRPGHWVRPVQALLRPQRMLENTVFSGLPASTGYGPIIMMYGGSACVSFKQVYDMTPFPGFFLTGFKLDAHRYQRGSMSCPCELWGQLQGISQMTGFDCPNVDCPKHSRQM